ARLPDEEEQIVADIVRDHFSQALDFHSLRTRKAGSHRHIDLHLVVKKDTRVEDAHRLCDHLEEEICAALPRSAVNIHIEPDSIFDRRPKDQGLDQEKRGASSENDQAAPD
ncbi:MAG: cation transporter dimerization domain-containing protein, partial [candidate division NC10 bacterium]|nr:cation transporter dimerization domain-containing protein [candidate division NC10 bacterium]